MPACRWPTTRVIQGVVSGIGFLGAGAILKFDKGTRVEGLTTAASIFLTCAMGLAAGLGHGWVACIAAAIALVVVTAIPRLMPGDHRADGARAISNEQRRESGATPTRST